MSEPRPKFGDWYRGIYAGESNPRRDGMFVEMVRRTGRINAGTFYRLTDGKGDFWEFPVESVMRLVPAAPASSEEEDDLPDLSNPHGYEDWFSRFFAAIDLNDTDQEVAESVRGLVHDAVGVLAALRTRGASIFPYFCPECDEAYGKLFEARDCCGATPEAVASYSRTPATHRTGSRVVCDEDTHPECDPRDPATWCRVCLFNELEVRSKEIGELRASLGELSHPHPRAVPNLTPATQTEGEG